MLIALCAVTADHAGKRVEVDQHGWGAEEDLWGLRCLLRPAFRRHDDKKGFIGTSVRNTDPFREVAGGISIFVCDALDGSGLNRNCWW